MGDHSIFIPDILFAFQKTPSEVLFWKAKVSLVIFFTEMPEGTTGIVDAFLWSN